MTGSFFSPLLSFHGLCVVLSLFEQPVHKYFTAVTHTAVFVSQGKTTYRGPHPFVCFVNPLSCSRKNALMDKATCYTEVTDVERTLILHAHVKVGFFPIVFHVCHSPYKSSDTVKGGRVRQEKDITAPHTFLSK